MLLDRRTAEAVADGSVRVVFRRWDVLRVHRGSTLRTVAGVVRVESVTATTPEALTEADAAAAGARSLARLRAELARRGSGQVYRIALGWAGPDERVRLRSALPDAEEVQSIRTELDRLDRGRRSGPWTRAVLRALAERPGVAAAELAASFGRERLAFKRDVRRLKELGLTHSRPVGYELSPRGRTYLEVSGDGR